MRACLALLLTIAPPAFAQEAADLDTLIDGAANPEAALALAHRQAGEGDLTGAVATLEGALLVTSEGEAAGLRLYMVALLCRLGDRQTAEAEFAALDGRGMRAEAWREARDACGTLPRLPPGPGRAREGISGEMTAGLAWDRDLAGMLLVRFDLPGVPGAREDGLSFAGSARIAARGRVGGGYVYGNASAIARNALSGPRVDYQILDAELGLGVQRDSFELSAGGVLRTARILGDRFVTEIGGAAEVALAAAGDARLTLRGEIVGQDYAGSIPAFSRDGTRRDLALDLRGRYGDEGLNYRFGIGLEDKSAETAGTGYRAARIEGDARQRIDSRGTYAGVLVTIRRADYDDAPGAAPVRELRYFGRLSLGTPIGPPGLAFEGAGSFTRRLYNGSSGLAPYSSLGAELALVWTFGD